MYWLQLKFKLSYSSGAMRDIREDLRQRLTRIGLQRAELQQRLAWLGDVQEHIKAALEYETRESDTDQSMLFSEFGEPEPDRSPLAQFLREVLSDLRPHTLEELKTAATARSLDFKGKNPGRVLHFALVGMAQSHLVESLGSGTWRLKQQVTHLIEPTLKTIDDATLM
jgi:hypothetical protein